MSQRIAFDDHQVGEFPGFNAPGVEAECLG